MAVYPFKDGTLLQASDNGVYFGDSVPSTGDFNVGDLLIVVSNTNTVSQIYPLMYRCVTASSSHNGGTWISVGGPHGVGAILATAVTIAPTYPVHHISGNSGIDTITAPTGLPNGGVITLIPDTAFTTTTSGNIAVATTAVANKPLSFTYDSGKSKFYPSY